MKFTVLIVVLMSKRIPAVAVAVILLWVVGLAGCTMDAQVNRSTSGVVSTAAAAQQTERERDPSNTVRVQDDANKNVNDAQATASAKQRPADQIIITTEGTSAQQAQNPLPATGAPVSTHRVVAGDTLTRIANKYAVSVASLLAANDLPNPDLLEVGQVITLPNPPVDYTPSFLILPDSRLVHSAQAAEFDVESFIRSRGGALSRMTVALTSRGSDGSTESEEFAASDVIERVSNEYSVDPRILLAFLEHFAGLVTRADVDAELRLYPLVEHEEASRIDRAGLYNQLSWLADRLNRGYYGWKYRGDVILDLPDGSRLFYDPGLNAATIAVQHVLAQMPRAGDWRQASDVSGIYRTYSELFGDPFAENRATVPAGLEQPELTLPFPRGETWRFTGGFHGGWGNGSAWAAVDFSPPPEDKPVGLCYTSSHPATAVARGTIARLEKGVVVLDLDEDSNEGSGWTILYLHVNHHDSLIEGQLVEAGNIIGYPSCLGGFTNATHLHIARRYNGEWIPADCNRCPPGVTVPPFTMSNWKVVGLANQLYQGFMVNQLDNRSAVAEQGRFTSINEITW